MDHISFFLHLPMLLKHPSFEFTWWESLTSPWFLKVMNDVWEGNNAVQAFMKKKKSYQGDVREVKEENSDF